MSGQFSAFAPFGVFRFSSKPSPCRQRYDEIRTSLGPAFDGPDQDAINYAIGMALGVAQLQLEAAGAQRDPEQVTYLLDDIERDYQLKPLPGDHVNMRRAALAAVMAVGRGGTRALVEAGLSALLGSLFVGCRWIETDEAATFPAARGKFSAAATPIRHVVLTERIYPGTVTTAYTPFLTDGIPLKIGDEITVAPGQRGLSERVTVEEAVDNTITATFTLAHDPDTRATTAPFPHWGSTKRQTVVVVGNAVDNAVLNNRRLLSQAEWFMRRTMTAVSTWTFCAGTVEYPTYIQVGVHRNVGYSPIQGLEP